MSSETEGLGAASAGALSQKTKVDLSGQPCQNCGTLVTERYCTTCGQLAASFHRPAWSLVGESVGDLFALDGRLARTLPLLLFRPGRLTKSYIDGQRARFVPPFRMFLLASLSFYLALFAVIGDGDWLSSVVPSDGAISAAIDDPAVAEEMPDVVIGGESLEAAEVEELVQGVTNIADRPDAFLRNLEKWAPRLSILLVPLTILALAILHFWKRRIYLYDHAVHALHLHSWIYLTGTVVLLANTLMGGGWSGWYALVIVIYVWRSLVVTYQANWMVAFVRLVMLLLFWLTAFSAQALAAIILSGVSVYGS
ncbi:MAG: DUF3667 domain-containing protein [Henriciella sp.]